MGERFDEMSTFMSYMRGARLPPAADLTKLFPSPPIPTEKTPSASRTSSAAASRLVSPRLRAARSQMEQVRRRRSLDQPGEGRARSKK